ncbi:MAG TPA: DUF4126 domain-containing protein [Myxococcota bacterium]|nr:DUF4126 domain-containing protein [Myxococcota bacterium]
MNPDLLGSLGLAAGGAMASGLRVYGTVAALGLLHRLGVLHLPPGLTVLATTPVIAVASALYAVEFTADKVPVVDSIWDAIHTFVRVPAAAVIGYTALGSVDEPWRTVAALLCGGVALSVHGAKSGARLAVQASPEPFSNWGLSFGEDLSVAGIFWLIVSHPLVPVALAALLLLAAALAIRWLGRSLRGLFARAPDRANREGGG